MVTDETLKRLPYWNRLSDREKEYLRQNAVIRLYDRGGYVKGGCVSCLGMIHVLSGSIRTLMISEEGREITLFRLNTGDSCILSASCILSQVSFETAMTATEETQLLVISLDAYAWLMEENIHVRCFTYELATERSSSVIWVLQQILFAKFDQRLARFLLAKCDRTGSTEITMTKEAIAQEVNSAREVVSRMLKQFSDDGIITMNHKTITVLHMNSLKKLL